jgi:hypothetical protein
VHFRKLVIQLCAMEMLAMWFQDVLLRIQLGTMPDPYHVEFRPIARHAC